MRYLHFRSVRGDLQEGNGCASRCQLSLFPVPIPVSPSTKSGFLCFFALLSPCFRAFRAQNRGFCAFLAFETPVFGHFEHKIRVFVRFYGLEPMFSGILSTKSRFLCFFCLRDPHFWHFRAQNRGFCALWWGHGWGDGQEQREQREQQEQQKQRSNRSNGRDSLGC